MSVLFVILPVVLVVVLGAVVAYSWAVKRGQFDDLDTPAIRMLHDDGVTRKPQPPAPDEAGAPPAGPRPRAPRHWGATLGELAAWVWAIVAGGGGLWLMWTSGPWRLTNGWFALASGLAACPLTAWVLKRTARLAVSGRVRFAVALLIWIAGRIARAVGV